MGEKGVEEPDTISAADQLELEAETAHEDVEDDEEDIDVDVALAALSIQAHALERFDQQRGNATLEGIRARISPVWF